MQSKPLFMRVPGDGLNFMDEVSNELDIPTLAVLEDYLNSFVGIVILVSHDRYFLDNTVDRIFAFDGSGRFRQYEGGYTEYLEAVKQELKDGNAAAGKIQGVKSDKKTGDGKPGGKASWDKGERKLRFSYKEQKEFETIEEDIAVLEEKLQDLETGIEAHASDYVKLAELSKEKESVQAALDEKMERWMYLTELNEKIQAQK